MSSIVIKKSVIINNVNKLLNDYKNYPHKIVSLKYNAYNHGSIIVNSLFNSGITCATVNSLEEGLEIRRINSQIDIIVLNEVENDNIYDAVVNNLILVVSNIDYLKELFSLDLKDKLRIHVEVDSGTNNLGIKSRNLFKNAIELINNHKFLELDGVFTNLEKIKNNYENYFVEFKNVTKDYNLSKLNYCYVLGKNVITFTSLPTFFNGIDFNNNVYGLKETLNDNFIGIIKNKFNNKEDKYNFDIAIEMISKLSNIKKVKKDEVIYGSKIKIKDDIMVGSILIGLANGISESIKEVLVNNKIRRVLAVLENKIIILLNKEDKSGSVVTLINNNVCNFNEKFFISFNSRLPQKYIND